METCANPGCDQPGTNKCSACKTTPYCGPICQTANWAHHKEECPGHLRKIGMAHLEKAEGFYLEHNCPQTIRHADLAATKLKQMKDRPVEDIDEALRMKYNALSFMARHREALECAKEWYCLWPTKHTHPPAIKASFALIESCIFNKKFFDAALFARTLWETRQPYPGTPTRAIYRTWSIRAFFSPIALGTEWRHASGRAACSRG